MSPSSEQKPRLWSNDFDEMAENVHSYITDFLSAEGLEAEEISGQRAERETGYRYTGPDFEFKFSLAGTVNSDPDILKDGERKIVFQVQEGSEAYTELLEDLEGKTGSQAERKEYEGTEIYDLELDTPRNLKY